MNNIHSNPLPKNQKRKTSVKDEPAPARGYRRITRQGSTYHVPGSTLLPVRMYDATFDEMTLRFEAQGQSVHLDTNNDRHDFVALTDQAEYELTLTLGGLPFSLTCEKVPGVLAAIYRQGTAKPLHVGQMLLCNDELTYRIPDLQLPAGKYAVLFAGIISGYDCFDSFDHVGEMPFYDFEILEHGVNLTHPSFCNHLPKGKDYLLLGCLDDTYNDRDEYRYVCYSDSYRPVYERYAGHDKPGFELTVYLRDAQWPLDDTYHLVMYHNNEPFMVCHYTTVDGDIRDLSVNTLTVTDPMYVLAKQVMAHPMKDGFCNEPGCKALKNLVLRLLAEPDTHRRSHMAISCANEPSYSFISAMLDMLYGHRMEDYEDMNSAYLQGQYEEMGAACFSRTFKARAVYLYDIPYLLLPEHRQLVADLDAYIARSGRKFHLFASASDMQKLFDRLPLSRNSFAEDHRLSETVYSSADVTHLVYTFLKGLDYRMTPDCLKGMQDYANREYNHFAQLDLYAINHWVEDQLVPYLTKEYAEAQSFNPLEMIDVDIDFDRLPSTAATTDEDTVFADCMAELNRMVGLENLKQSLETLFCRTKFDRMRVRMGLPALSENRHHMIFTGNPGTGKTTVAKMIGRVFKELGILSKGEVITAERADMVGKYIGHTEDNMKSLLEKAKGNVLFIDEAYSLCDNRSEDRADFGHRALECLLTALASNESDMIVIMAGYEKQMKRMLETNPGMRGRFPYLFNFEDYTAEELSQICVNKLVAKEFAVTEDVKDVLVEYIRKAVQEKGTDFHNARWAEQFAMVGIVSAMAGRIAKAGNRTPIATGDLCNVLAEDVVKGYELTKQWSDKKPASQPVRSIGFR